MAKLFQAITAACETTAQIIKEYLDSKTATLTNNVNAATNNVNQLAAGIEADLSQRDRVVSLLDNSDFSAARFIAAAGLNGMHGTARYLGDRWLGHTSITATQQTDGVLLSSAATSAYIAQKVSVKTGQAYTLAFYATGRSGAHRIAVYDGDVATIAAQAQASDRDLLLVNFTATQDVMAMLYYPGYTTSGGSAVLQWAALYGGTYTADTLPAYTYKGYAAELAECQRYYENSYSALGLTSKNEYIGIMLNGTMLDCPVSFTTPKRVTPTITLHPEGTASGWRIYNGSAYSVLGSAEPQVARDTAGFNVRGTKAADDATTWATGKALPVLGHWEASADL